MEAQAVRREEGARFCPSGRGTQKPRRQIRKSYRRGIKAVKSKSYERRMLLLEVGMLHFRLHRALRRAVVLRVLSQHLAGLHHVIVNLLNQRLNTGVRHHGA